jgi:hypothetical protein
MTQSSCKYLINYGPAAAKDVETVFILKLLESREYRRDSLTLLDRRHLADTLHRPYLT